MVIHGQAIRFWPIRRKITMTTISHSKAFRDQPDLPAEAKIKVGQDIWTPGTHGSRLYAQVLSKNPATVAKVIALASELKDSPFTAKQTMGHLRWLFTSGELSVDGTSYVVQAKASKPAKPEPAKAEKPKAKVKIEPKAEPRTAASRKRSLVRTKKPARAA
jgi:hypothetical protein